jgi:uncharacterized protein involved in exopolysaccharide biosynthesis
MFDYSNQEIDIRRYIQAVLSKWYWILGLALFAGILAYSVSHFFQEPVYEATALVSLVEPRQQVQFDPRIVTVTENPPPRAYPEIAVSDEMLVALKNEYPVAASFSLPRLRSMLKVSSGADASLLNLTVTNADPSLAAELANAWAELFVSWANETYGDSSGEQLVFFEQRMEEAAAELAAAEDMLITYQAENRTAILENELAALSETHASLFAKEREIALLSSDIESLVSSDQADATNDQITALIMKLRALGDPSTNDGEATANWLQLSIDTSDSDEGVEPKQQLLSLQAILVIQAQQTAEALAEIEPQILVIQQEAQAAITTQTLLERDIELATDTYTALARTVEEKRITSQASNAWVRLVSRSATPTVPVGQHKSRNALAAAVGIAFISTLVILVRVWWRSDKDSVPKPTAVENRSVDSEAQPIQLT